MAIASGTPVPPVYLMQGEKGINAFAAGYTPNDAVIGVTQGLHRKLNRSQLQGVIAHEFSHILNGDMRLNIRLIGILNGILIIGMIGYFVMRITAFSGSGRSREQRQGWRSGHRNSRHRRRADHRGVHGHAVRQPDQGGRQPAA